MNNAKPQQLFATIFSIALSLGLLLGLFVGWVLWPVEWEGATLRDLDTAEKAEYLAAVADAFVIYSDPEAAEIAWRRLQGFEPEIQQTFNDAILYFRDSQQPERAIRISNLGRLASAIGLVPPTLAASDSAAAGQAPELVPLPTQVGATNDTTASGVTTTATTTEASSQWQWLLWLLVLLLMGGGLYLLFTVVGIDRQAWFITLRERFQQWRDRRGSSANAWENDTLGDDEFTDDDYAVGGQRGRGAQPLPGRSMVMAHDDLAFEAEDEDSDWRAPAARYRDTDERRDTFTAEETDAYRRPPAETARNRADERFEQAYDEADEAEFAVDHFAQDDDDDVETQRGPAQPGNRFTVTDYQLADEDESDEDLLEPTWEKEGAAHPTPSRLAGHSHTLDEEIDEDGDEEGAEEEEIDDEDDPSARRATPPVEPLARHREPTPAASAAPLPAQRTRYKILDQHTLQYRVGMHEYDESKAILDPAAGKYIGEFGMGVSTKNALVQTGPDQVVALEVWLFDKSDERSMGQQTRILLSEYAVDNNLEQVFLKERQDNPRPFTAQPNVHFQLESQNLLLDCVIIEVKYAQSGAAKGIFHNIKVEMTVQQKR